MNKDRPLKYQNKGNLIQGSIQGHLLRLSIPMIWGILSIISFQLVDTFYISLLGTAPLAAITFTFPVTYMIFSFIMGFGIATSSVVSRLIGEGQQETVRRVTTHALILVFVMGLVISAVGILLHDSIFGLMGAPAGMIPMIRDYMHIWFAGAIFITVPMIGNSAMRAAGDSKIPAMIMATVAIVNVILDPILIFGLFGFPRLEMQGAAIATILANGCALAAGLYVLILHKKLVCGLGNLQIAQFGNSLKRLLFIAVPAGLTNAIQPLVNAIIISLLAIHGAQSVAAFGVVSRIEAFAFVVLMALAVGMGPVVGQNWGAEKYDRVREALKLAMRFNIGWSLLVAVVLGLLGRPIASVFSDDPVVIGYAVLFFWIVPFSYAFSNVINGWASAFNAMGMPQRSFAMIVIKMLVMTIPAIYVGNYYGGITGIFVAMAAVNVVAGSIIHTWSWRQCGDKETT